MNRRTLLAWLPLVCTCIVGLVVVVFDLQSWMQRLASLSTLDAVCYGMCMAVGGYLYKCVFLPPTFDDCRIDLTKLKPAARQRLLKRQLHFQWQCLKRVLPASHKRHQLVAMIGTPRSGRQSCLQATEALQPVTLSKIKTPLPFDVHFWYGDGQIVCVLSPTLHPDLTHHQNSVLLQQLHRFLKRKWWSKHPWHRFFILTPISALKTTTQAEQEATITAINGCLAAFKHAKKIVPIDVIFGHMDHVAGFAPFFEHLDDRARQDAWAFSVQDLTTFSLPQFNKPFRAWIDQLNQCLIKRLHHESQHHRLCLIKDFPIQLEKLKECMFWWLSQLAVYPHYRRNGVLFISAKQDGRYLDFLRPCLMKERTLMQPCQTGAFYLDQNYFCHRILHVPTCKKPLFSGPSASLVPQGMAAVVLMLCIVAMMVFGRHAYWLYEALHHQRPTSMTPSYVAFEAHAPKWANLQRATQWLYWQDSHPVPAILGHPTTVWVEDILRFVARTQKDIIENVILKTHHRRFLQAWQHASTATLRHRVFEQYDAILHEANPKRPRLQSWLKHIWQGHIPPAVLDQRMALLTSLLPKLNNKIFQADILSWRKSQLKHLTLSESVLMLLPTHQKNFLKSLYKINFSKYETLPDIPAPQNFSSVMHDTIPSLCHQIAQQRQPTMRAQDASVKTCVVEAQRIILKRYVAFWLSIPGKIKSETPSTLQAQIQALHQAAQGQLAMQQQWHAVHQALQVTQAFKHLIPRQDQHSIQHVSETDQLMHDVKWMTILAQVQHQLTQVRKDPSGAQGFKLSIDILNQKNHNQPMLSWFDLMDEMPPSQRVKWLPMAELVVQTLFNNAAKHIDAVWQITGKKFFDQYLANRYPLSTHALRDASLADFSQFFTPKHGILTLFTQHYLVPFLEPHHNHLKFKQFRGHTVPIHQDALSFFAQSRDLQAMFFPNDTLRVHFSLMPLQVPTHSGFQTTLDLSSKNIILDAQKHRMMMLQWPMRQSRMTGITIASPSGQSWMISRHGPWALFRLLDTAHVQKNADDNLPHLIFNVHGMPVVLALETDSIATNPFKPELFKTYHLPNHLT